MRARLFGAALQASTAFLAVAPSALAQPYGSYPSGYGTSGQPTDGPQYGGGYTTSPYAGVCASLAASRATQGSAALAASPYTQTCEHLGLLGSAPGAGYAAGGSWVSGSGLAAWTGLSYPGPGSVPLLLPHPERPTAMDVAACCTVPPATAMPMAPAARTARSPAPSSRRGQW